MTRQLNNGNGIQARWTRTPAPNRVACPTMQNMAGRGAHTTVSRLHRDRQYGSRIQRFIKHQHLW